jgi:hypothetical protein
MSQDIELVVLIDLIYEAALDSELWPNVLIRLAAGCNVLDGPSRRYCRNDCAAL